MNAPTSYLSFVPLLVSVPRGHFHAEFTHFSEPNRWHSDLLCWCVIHHLLSRVGFNILALLIVARLWRAITGYRVVTHYGSTPARLDRSSNVLLPRQTGWSAAISSSLTFGSYDHYLAELEAVYADHLLLASPDKIRGFFSDRLQDWKLSTALALASLQ